MYLASGGRGWVGFPVVFGGPFLKMIWNQPLTNETKAVKAQKHVETQQNHQYHHAKEIISSTIETNLGIFWNFNKAVNPGIDLYYIHRRGFLRSLQLPKTMVESPEGFCLIVVML